MLLLLTLADLCQNTRRPSTSKLNEVSAGPLFLCRGARFRLCPCSGGAPALSPRRRVQTKPSLASTTPTAVTSVQSEGFTPVSTARSPCPPTVRGAACRQRHWRCRCRNQASAGAALNLPLPASWCTGSEGQKLLSGHVTRQQRLRMAAAAKARAAEEAASEGPGLHLAIAAAERGEQRLCSKARGSRLARLAEPKGAESSRKIASLGSGTVDSTTGKWSASIQHNPAQLQQQQQQQRASGREEPIAAPTGDSSLPQQPDLADTTDSDEEHVGLSGTASSTRFRSRAGSPSQASARGSTAHLPPPLLRNSTPRFPTRPAEGPDFTLAHDSVGKQVVSSRQSAPQYSFGSAARFGSPAGVFLGPNAALSTTFSVGNLPERGDSTHTPVAGAGHSALDYDTAHAMRKASAAARSATAAPSSRDERARAASFKARALAKEGFTGEPTSGNPANSRMARTRGVSIGSGPARFAQPAAGRDSPGPGAYSPSPTWTGTFEESPALFPAHGSVRPQTTSARQRSRPTPRFAGNSLSATIARDRERQMLRRLGEATGPSTASRPPAFGSSVVKHVASHIVPQSDDPGPGAYPVHTLNLSAVLSRPVVSPVLHPTTVAPTARAPGTAALLGKGPSGAATPGAVAPGQQRGVTPVGGRGLPARPTVSQAGFQKASREQAAAASGVTATQGGTGQHTPGPGQYNLQDLPHGAMSRFRTAPSSTFGGLGAPPAGGQLLEDEYGDPMLLLNSGKVVMGDAALAASPLVRHREQLAARRRGTVLPPATPAPSPVKATQHRPTASAGTVSSEAADMVGSALAAGGALNSVTKSRKQRALAARAASEAAGEARRREEYARIPGGSLSLKPRGTPDTAQGAQPQYRLKPGGIFEDAASPGPGAYSQATADAVGPQALSKRASSPSYTFSRSSKRFIKPVADRLKAGKGVPGPGHYFPTPHFKDGAVVMGDGTLVGYVTTAHELPPGARQPSRSSAHAGTAVFTPVMPDGVHSDEEEEDVMFQEEQRHASVAENLGPASLSSSMGSSGGFRSRPRLTGPDGPLRVAAGSPAAPAPPTTWRAGASAARQSSPAQRRRRMKRPVTTGAKLRAVSASPFSSPQATAKLMQTTRREAAATMSRTSPRARLLGTSAMPSATHRSSTAGTLARPVPLGASRLGVQHGASTSSTSSSRALAKVQLEKTRYLAQPPGTIGAGLLGDSRYPTPAAFSFGAAQRNAPVKR